MDGYDGELVALAFSQSPISTTQWRRDLDVLRSNLEQALDAYTMFDVQSTAPNFLDHDESTDSARVAKLTMSFGGQLTAGECSAMRSMELLEDWESEAHVQLILQPGDLYARHRLPGLAVFDMDSTLIQQEVIDELARAVGLYDRVAAITEAAMRGEAPYADFEASLRARVALLRGVPTSVWAELKAHVITFTPGAHQLVRVLRHLGWKTAVLSGGFTPLASWVQETLGLDYAYANQLVSDPALDILTGELVPGAPIVHAQKKRELLSQLAVENGIPPSQTIAIGDGSNDLPMMRAAGLGIAFNAKPRVQRAAPARLNGRSLLDVMHVLGYSKSEVDGILANYT